MKVIAFGEILFDVYAEKSVIGGAPFNFCAHLAHLGEDTYLVTAVAEDELGKIALQEMRRHGIRTELVSMNEYPTGRCNVTLNENKVPEYKICTDVAYDHITATDDVLERIQKTNADVFYFNTLIQRAPTSRNSLERILSNCCFRDIFCDINLRKDCFDRESLLRCLTNATILKLSDEETHSLFELGLLPSGEEELKIPELLCKKYPNVRLAILTRGNKGSAVYEQSTGRLYLSGEPKQVKVVSTVGAGDCYGATFLHTIYSGASVPEAIQAATERSNIVVAHRESVPF